MLAGGALNVSARKSPVRQFFGGRNCVKIPPIEKCGYAAQAGLSSGTDLTKLAYALPTDEFRA